MIIFDFYSREAPDMSAKSEKIFHRSLDLLQFWITDCQQVDFTPKSSLVDTLETFLNTEVHNLRPTIILIILYYNITYYTQLSVLLEERK